MLEVWLLVWSGGGFPSYFYCPVSCVEDCRISVWTSPPDSPAHSYSMSISLSNSWEIFSKLLSTVWPAPCQRWWRRWGEVESSHQYKPRVSWVRLISKTCHQVSSISTVTALPLLGLSNQIFDKPNIQMQCTDRMWPMRRQYVVRWGRELSG